MCQPFPRSLSAEGEHDVFRPLLRLNRLAMMGRLFTLTAVLLAVIIALVRSGAAPSRAVFR